MMRFSTVFIALVVLSSPSYSDPGSSRVGHQEKAEARPHEAMRQWPAPTTEGAALFVEKCAMCHRERGMGTGLLMRRTDIPYLEDRQDLTPEMVILFARTGIGNMPRISRGEVSDTQLTAIAHYLSHTE